MIAFEPVHMDLLDPWPGQGPLMRPPDEGLVSYTIACGDRPIACGGVQKVWERCGYAWIALSSHARAAHRYSIAKLAKKTIEACHEDYTLDRIQAYIDEDNTPAVCFASALGFITEGRAKRFGPGAVGTYLLMARVW